MPQNCNFLHYILRSETKVFLLKVMSICFSLQSYLITGNVKNMFVVHTVQSELQEGSCIIITWKRI
jgi:hypothetical protein